MVEHQNEDGPSSNLVEAAQLQFGRGQFRESAALLQQHVATCGSTLTLEANRLIVQHFLGGVTGQAELVLALWKLTVPETSADDGIDKLPTWSTSALAPLPPVFLYNLALLCCQQHRYGRTVLLLETLPFCKSSDSQSAILTRTRALYLTVCCFLRRFDSPNFREVLHAFSTEPRSSCDVLHAPCLLLGSSVPDSPLPSESRPPVNGSSSPSSTNTDNPDLECQFLSHVFRGRSCLRSNLKAAGREAKQALEMAKTINDQQQNELKLQRNAGKPHDEAAERVMRLMSDQREAMALMVKAEISYRKNHFRKAMKLLTMSQFNLEEDVTFHPATSEVCAVVFYNNLGLVHYRLAKAALASVYFNKALAASRHLRSASEPLSIKNMGKKPQYSAAKQWLIRDPEIYYNLGVQQLIRGVHLLALGSLRRSVQCGLQPTLLLWLRIGECCLAIEKSESQSQRRDPPPPSQSQITEVIVERELSNFIASTGEVAFTCDEARRVAFACFSRCLSVSEETRSVSSAANVNQAGFEMVRATVAAMEKLSFTCLLLGEYEAAFKHASAALTFEKTIPTENGSHPASGNSSTFAAIALKQIRKEDLSACTTAGDNHEDPMRSVACE